MPEGPFDSVEGRPLEESELVARATGGDAHAYEELVRMHQQVAMRTAWLVTRNATEAQDALQLQRARAMLRGGDPPDGAEPEGQGLPRVLEDRARRHRGLMFAAGTDQQASRGRPRRPAAAARAGEPVRPSLLQQVVPTRLLRAKPRFQVGQGAGKSLHAHTTTYGAYWSQLNSPIEAELAH